MITRVFVQFDCENKRIGDNLRVFTSAILFQDGKVSETVKNNF